MELLYIDILLFNLKIPYSFLAFYNIPPNSKPASLEISKFASSMDPDLTKSGIIVMFLKVADVLVSQGKSSKTEWQRTGKMARNLFRVSMAQQSCTWSSVFAVLIYNLCIHSVWLKLV